VVDLMLYGGSWVYMSGGRADTYLFMVMSVPLMVILVILVIRVPVSVVFQYQTVSFSALVLWVMFSSFIMA